MHGIEDLGEDETIDSLPGFELLGILISPVMKQILHLETNQRRMDFTQDA